MDAVYISEPVNTARDELRLITIDHSSTVDRLSCTLEAVSLRDVTEAYSAFLENRPSSATSLSTVLAEWIRTGSVGIFPEYTQHRFQWGDYSALSYVWGNRNKITMILVNGVKTPVTKNLAEALHRLRETGQFAGRFRLWVDALCINQKDNEERRAHVGVMRIFHSQAWSVIGFLGPQEDESDKAFELIDVLADIYHSHAKCEELKENMMQDKHSHVPGSWLALKRLTLRPYWERLWIMQELALGGARTVLFCGSKQIGWQTFCRGLGVIHFYLWTPRHKALDRDLQMMPNLGDTFDRDKDARGWYDTRTLDHIWKDLWRLTQVEESRSKSASFTRLMEIANSCDCSHARDKVYGLLGVMDPVLAKAIIPNYTGDTAAVSSGQPEHTFRLITISNCCAMPTYGAESTFLPGSLIGPGVDEVATVDLTTSSNPNSFKMKPVKILWKGGHTVLIMDFHSRYLRESCNGSVTRSVKRL